MSDQEYYNQIINNGGISLDERLEHVTGPGFIVSRAGMEAQIPIDVLTPELTGSLIHSYLGKSEVIGAWLNTDNNMVYFDSSRIFTDRSQAEEFGRENKQLAIWDLDNNCEIRL